MIGTVRPSALVRLMTSSNVAPCTTGKGRTAMQIVGLVISWAVAIGIIGIGIGYAAKSEMNATRFGLPQLPEREVRGWWQVKGVRDIVSGVLVITARADLWWLILVLSLIPLGDALVV